MRKYIGKAMLASLAILALVVAGAVTMAQNAPPAGAPGGAPGGTPGQPGAANQGGRRGGGPGGRGNFDPAQFRTMMLDRMKETLGCSDDEWKAISPLVSNVMEKQAALRSGGNFGMFGRRGGPGGGPGGDRGNQPGDRGGDRGRFGTPDPELAALNTALENKNTPAKDIEAKLKALRDARAKKEADLKTAREELRKVLTIRQEAQLVLSGMLD